MADIETLQDTLIKVNSLAEAGDEDAKNDRATLIDEIRRLQSAGASQKPASGVRNFMGHVNEGIASTAGGLVDLINPFDKPHALNPFPEGTGSMAQGLRNDMDHFGIARADGPPETFMENVAQGVGEGAAALVPAAKGLQVAQALATRFGLSKTATAAEIVQKGLSTLPGAVAEVAASGISLGAGSEAEQATIDAGYPELAPIVRSLVEVAAPLAAAGVAMGARPYLSETFKGAGTAVANAAERTPIIGIPTRLARAAAKSVGPQTATGAREVVRDQLLLDAGSEARLREIGENIDPKNEFGLTGAEQSGDPRLLRRQAGAIDEQPEIRERIAARQAKTQGEGRFEINEMGGDIDEARMFFDRRLRTFTRNMEARLERTLAAKDAAAARVGNKNPESFNSEAVNRKLQSELDDAKVKETDLWDQVDNSVKSKTDNARATMKAWEQEFGKVGFEDLPPTAKRWVLEKTPQKGKNKGKTRSGLGKTTTVGEMKTLYSKLRQLSRNKKVDGGGQNERMAMVADRVADAVLEDLDATDASDALREARKFTLWMHDRFDKGPVGDILAKTRTGETNIRPYKALGTTMKAGVDTKEAAEKIVQAAPTARENVEDFSRQQFTDKLFQADGTFRPKDALEWMRENREFLNANPGLKRDFAQAVRGREQADDFMARQRVIAGLDDVESIPMPEGGPPRSAKEPVSRLKEFNSGQPQTAVNAILKADNPVKAAASIVSTARKDGSGEVLDGVKGAITDYLINGALKGGKFSGTDLKAFLNNPATRDAIRLVMSANIKNSTAGKDQFKRIEQIADALSKIDAAQAATPDGAVMDSAPARVIETVAAITGARAGTAINSSLAGSTNAGNALVAAGRGSTFAQRLLDNLTNDRARQIMFDAIEDPALMRAIMLREPVSGELPKWARNKLAPYLVGAAVPDGEEEDG